MSGKNSSTESAYYAALGASSSKQGIHQAVGESGYSSHFVKPFPDIAGSSDWYSLLHADGAGTKSLAAYIAFRESGDSSWFRGLAQDCLVMNLDDLACVGPISGLMLSNTIGRNRHLVPDSAIEEIITGYRSCVEMLQQLGLPITLCGGETADMGDAIRTLVVDATMFARVPKSEFISFDRIQAGDLIIGLSSTGQASFESKPNSGIGSNGITLARHALISKYYAAKYPEIVDPQVDPEISYRGTAKLFDQLDTSAQTVAEALLSPTRPYAPLVIEAQRQLGADLHGAVHCTGGGQTKIGKFLNNLTAVKNSLFPCPAVFREIQKNSSVGWDQMYAVCNMGHRMELVCRDSAADKIIQIASSFGIAAQQIGKITTQNESGAKVIIQGEYGEFAYR